LQELHVARHERVLEVGAGSGHMAALLAHKGAAGGHAGDPPGAGGDGSGQPAPAGVLNASVREVDGSRGLPGEAPFDVIVLSGSVAEVPQRLLDQLKIGGRLVAIVGQEPVMHALLVTRVAEHQCKRVELFDTVAPRLQGFPEPALFRILTRDALTPANSPYVRMPRQSATFAVTTRAALRESEAPRRTVSCVVLTQLMLSTLALAAAGGSWAQSLQEIYEAARALRRDLPGRPCAGRFGAVTAPHRAMRCAGPASAPMAPPDASRPIRRPP